jgi:hypothetical protein
VQYFRSANANDPPIKPVPRIETRWMRWELKRFVCRLPAQ